MVNGPILVSGGAGFIGRQIVIAARAVGLEVRIADLQPAQEGAASDKDVTGDLADTRVAARAISGVDAVCHQASMVGLGVDFRDVGAYVHHNLAATASLLGALHAGGFSGRIVLASSMVIYGEGAYRCGEHGVVRPGPRAEASLQAGAFEPLCPRCERPLEAEVIDEDAAPDPRNVYATTKLAQEHLCDAYAREHAGCTVTALRYHNVYGPGMPRDTPYAGVASIFLSALARNVAPQVFEDGGQRRDFVHVRDVAEANIRALTAPVPYHGALNVASGQPRTVLDMAEALAGAFGPDAAQPQVTGGYRLGDVRHIVASPARAHGAIDFAARIPFVEGMQELAAAGP